MPAIGGTDLADLEAKASAELGFSRQLEQSRRVTPPPRFGGSGGYPVWYREIQLDKFNAVEAIEVSLASIYRWDVRHKPFRQTGNGPRTTVVGVDLLNLVTYITTWPDRTLDEMAAFIYNEGGISTPARQYLIAFRILMSRGIRRPPKDTRHSGRTLSFVSGDFGIVLLLLVY